MRFRITLSAALLGLNAFALSSTAQAESISEALALAYANNPTLNAARATLRATDERVPQALANWRPTITANASVGSTRTSTGIGPDNIRNNASMSLSIQQALFRGFRTVNSTKQAEALVRAQRESLNATEQDVLLSAAQAYVNVIRDTALVALQRSSVEFLREQVRASKDQFEVGEGTRTDVSQAEARHAEAQANLNSAIANLNASRAVYEQVVGIEARNLSASTPVGRLMPRSVEEAIRLGEEYQPLLRQAQHQVDAAAFNVKTIEGEQLPTVSLEGSIGRDWKPSTSVNTLNTASVVGRVSVPLYQGGALSSRVRQAKEELGQAEIQLDVLRNQIRANVITAWGDYQAAEASITAAQAAVEAQQLALQGVIEEQRVGQRTTLDVLDSQRELITQRSNLVTAQRNRIVSAYQLLSAMGRLDAEFLNLQVARYEPTEHYSKVRDKWFGMRTPDGR